MTPAVFASPLLQFYLLSVLLLWIKMENIFLPRPQAISLRFWHFNYAPVTLCAKYGSILNKCF